MKSFTLHIPAASRRGSVLVLRDLKSVSTVLRQAANPEVSECILSHLGKLLNPARKFGGSTG